MKTTSKLLLKMAEHLPRGYARVIQFAARQDRALQDLPIRLKQFPTPLRADLRESVYVPFFRAGPHRHQVGLDRVVQRIVRPGDRVFDIGANIGYTAALYAHLVGPSGRVLALEPSPRAYFLLQRSLSGIANVDLLNVGASDEAGELAFYVPPCLDVASFVPIAGATRHMVKTETVDALVEMYGAPHIIKVDVEGYEPSVFRGAASTLSGQSPPVLIFEALRNSTDDLAASLGALNHIAPSRYRCWRVKRDGSLCSVDEDGTSNLLAVPGNAMERMGGLVCALPPVT